MSNTTAMQGMLYRMLGSTGEKVSAIGIGGSHIGLNEVDEQLSIRIIRTAVDRGITFMDNSWDYNEGDSEIRMGKALRDGYRDRVFLMTKIDGRSKKEAARQLDQSLRRLQVDMIDLVQHHEVLRYEDPHRIFDGEGANAALVEARKAGKLRMEILDQACEAVRTFRPMSVDEVRSLLSKTATAAARGDFEPFKTSSIFDGTARNPEWLGEEPQRLQQLMPM